MFGAIGYLPTYLQMVTGATATNAGLLMIPMMGALLLTSMGAGSLVSADGGINSLTPEFVAALPDALRDPIIQSYNDALTPLFLYMAPLGVIAAVLPAFVEEKPLATVIKR